MASVTFSREPPASHVSVVESCPFELVHRKATVDSYPRWVDIPSTPRCSLLLNVQYGRVRYAHNTYMTDEAAGGGLECHTAIASAAAQLPHLEEDEFC